MRYIFAIFLLLFFVACSIKPNVLTLNSYKPTSSKISNKISIQKAYIKSIIDTREDETIVGLVDNISNTYPLFTDTNIKLWFYNALVDGLRAKGYEIVKEPLKEALAIKVAIIKFDINYSKAITKYNNLKGVLDIQLSLAKGFKNDVENILQTQKSFYEDTPSKEELETLMQTLVDDMVSQIIQKGTSL